MSRPAYLPRVGAGYEYAERDLGPIGSLEVRLPWYPEGRCRAMVTSSRTGRRCRRRVAPGETRCRVHVGVQDYKTEYHVHRFYISKLRPTLLEALEVAVKESPVTDQLSLLDEVALARLSAADVIGKYSEAVELAERTGDQRALLVAGEMMRDVLRDVAARVKDASAVEAVKANLLSGIQNAVGMVITQVIQQAQETFKDDFLVREFETRLRERLELSEAQQERLGTDLTPDQVLAQAVEIDSLVP